MGKSFVYNTGLPEEGKEYLDLAFKIFFDGTLNNKANTLLREQYEANERKVLLKKDPSVRNYEQELKSAEKKIKEVGQISSYGIAKYEKGVAKGLIDKSFRVKANNSYMNDYTNVARMWKCFDDGNEIYIEGIGTLNTQKDDDDGFQYGSGKTGIRGKVRLGCENLAIEINRMIGEGSNKTLSSITLDVFGFSRGAAAARNFAYEVNKKPAYQAPVEMWKTPAPKKKTQKLSALPENKTEMQYPSYKTVYFDSDGIRVDEKLVVNGMLPEKGYLGYLLVKNTGLTLEELKSLKINLRFVGVYDTVASYSEFGVSKKMTKNDLLLDKGAKVITKGSKEFFKNGSKELHLDEMGPLGKCVHFTAMNEHRENFSLTRVSKSGYKDGKCIEKDFPGVHCDIGGAYLTGNEIVDQLETSNYKPFHKLTSYKEYLIGEHWFKKDEIEINNRAAEYFGIVLPPNIKKVTSPIRYSRISTHRKNVKKEYSYIPLHFMAEFALPFIGNDILKKVLEKYPMNSDINLVRAKAHLRKYVFGGKNAVKWEFVNDKIFIETEKRDKFLKELKDGSYERKMNELPAPDRPGTPIKLIPLKNAVIPKLSPLPVTEREVLKKIRNEYLHWSSTREWLGMDPFDSPTNDYKRNEYNDYTIKEPNPKFKPTS